MSASDKCSLNPPQREIFSIGRLNREVRSLLEGHLPMIWVEGEISNLARPASGHFYFSLKDEQAQVRCAMFRMRRKWLRFQPENGQQVLLRARVTLYEPRGDYQLLVDSMQQAGAGALQRAYERLKARLAAEGLFDPAHKRPLPLLPQQVGVVTSPGGAAIRDIISVLKRRYPSIPVIIYPVPVQGEAAAAEIAEAIRLAGQRRECDVLIIGRGGGSLEDLWAFNEEVVARAIHDSPIPVVSAVGHETDFTISDLVADRRAATPSAAAEQVSPDRQEQLQTLRQLTQRLAGLQHRRLRHQQQQLDWLQHRLQQQRPAQRLRMQAQRLDELELRLSTGLRQRLRHQQSRLSALQARLHPYPPGHRLQHLRIQVQHLQQRLQTAQTHRQERDTHQLAGLVRALEAVSPLATLSRGYAIISDRGGRVIHRATEVQVGDQLKVRLSQDRLCCRVERCTEE